MEIDNVNVEETNKFHINSSFKEFTDRQKSVFDQLGALEQSTRSTLSQYDAPKETKDHENTTAPPQKSPLRHLRGTESLFKKPQARPLKHFKSLLNRTVPDYQINPHKWTRYSLDVPKEDMSEKANTSAAMSFLKELEVRNQESLDSPPDEGPTKITFKKVHKKSETEKATVSFRNSKIVMPEYVVGHKPQKTKSKLNRPKTDNSKDEVKLNHISFDDDDEDIDN